MIRACDLFKSYGSADNPFPVLRGISLDIEDGEFAVILGASGSGKSTLLNVLSGLETPDQGDVYYEEKKITGLSESELTRFRREQVGFIFQQYYLLPHMNVDKNVKMGADLSGNKDYREVIEAVGLGDKLEKLPGELSGGEQQRVAIARALANDAPIIFADEPTGNLDRKNGAEVLDLLFGLADESRKTLVIVTHDEHLARRGDRIITIMDGHAV